MTTEDLIESFISEGIRAYKKLNRNSPEGRKLDRHEAVMIDGVEFSCWREWTCYKMAEHLKDVLPDMYVELTLDGNDSVLVIEVDEVQQRKLNGVLFSFLDGLKLV